MKKSTKAHFCGLIFSLSPLYLYAEPVNVQESQYSDSNPEQNFRTLHKDLNISSLSGREKAHNYILEEVNKKLDALKKPDQKFSFLMAMNQVFKEGFHVNYNAFVHLNDEDKAFMDGYYTSMLVLLDDEIKEGKKSKVELIEEYESKYPFKVFNQDLDKVQAVNR